MQYIGAKLFERELKKGSTELLILSLVEHRPRHGYEISKLIEQRSEGLLKFNVASFYPLLYRLEKRGFIRGRWVEREGMGEDFGFWDYSFPRSAWERIGRRSASREGVFIWLSSARDAERRKARSHAERGNEFIFLCLKTL